MARRRGAGSTVSGPLRLIHVRRPLTEQVVPYEVKSFTVGVQVLKGDGVEGGLGEFGSAVQVGVRDMTVARRTFQA